MRWNAGGKRGIRGYQWDESENCRRAYSVAFAIFVKSFNLFLLFGRRFVHIRHVTKRARLERVSIRLSHEQKKRKGRRECSSQSERPEPVRWIHERQPMVGGVQWNADHRALPQQNHRPPPQVIRIRDGKGTLDSMAPFCAPPAINSKSARTYAPNLATRARPHLPSCQHTLIDASQTGRSHGPAVVGRRCRVNLE